MEGVYDQIHDLPPNWQRSKLGDVMEVIRGASPRPKSDPRYFGGRIPWVMISDVTREKGKYLSNTRDHVTEEGAKKSRYLKAGTLILSNSGTVCVPKILAVDGCIHDGFVAFPSIPEGFDILYLYYFFDHIRPRVIDAHRQGITQVNLNTNIVKNIQVPVPSRHEQEEIVAEIEKQFSRLDEAVASLKRTKANLKRYKAAVLKAAVEGRLVETEAEIARRNGRGYETGEQLLQRILETRRSQWKDKGKYKEPAVADSADLPKLPEGWVWAGVDTVCSRIVDCPHSTPSFQSEGFPCIDTTWMTTEGLAIERARYVDDATYLERIARLEPKPGDLIFAREGTIGTAVLVPDRMKPCLGQRVMLLRSSKFYLNGFLRHVLHSETVKRQYRVQALGSTVAHINVGAVKGFKVPVPPLAEQNRIVAEVDRRLSVIDELEATIEANLSRADRLRQSILLKAFSGSLVGKLKYQNRATA